MALIQFLNIILSLGYRNLIMNKTIFSLIFCLVTQAHSLLAVWSYPLSPTAPDIIASGFSPVGSNVSSDASNGNAVAVWFNSSTSGTEASIKPFGQSWSSAQPISISGHTSGPYADVSMNTSGTAIAVWTDVNPPASNVISASIYTSSWSTPFTISNPASGFDSTAPHVSIDSLGNAIAVWYDLSGSSPKSIQARRYVNGALQAIQQLDSVPSSVTPFSPSLITQVVEADANGNAVVVWTSWDGTNTRIAYATYTVSTSSWFISLPTYLSTLGVNASNPFVSVNSAGNAMIMWNETVGGNFVIRATTLDVVSGLWTTPLSAQTLTLASESSEFPVAAFDESGNAVAVWTNNTSSTVNSSLYTKSSNTWSTEQAISPVNSSNAWVCVDQKGDAIASWINNSVNTPQAAYLPSGGAWSSSQSIAPDNSANNTTYAKVSSDATGYVIAVWGNQIADSVESVHWTPPPTIISINPDSGPSTGGNTVIITGTNFTNFQEVTTTSITFGLASASYTVTSRASLSITVPPEAAALGKALVPVTVTTQAGSATSTYTYSGPNPPRHFHGRLYRKDHLHFNKHFRLFTRWKAPLDTAVQSYKIYRDGKARYTIPGRKKKFKKFITSTKKDLHKRYRISAVDVSGAESKKVKLKIVKKAK